MPSERPYSVEERLAGTAYYTVWATSAAEARRKVKNGEVGMDDNNVDHMGVMRVRRIREEATHAQ